MLNEKMSVAEVGQRINQEGIGYAIQHYMTGKDIADPVLAKMWNKAAKMLNKIEKYIAEKSIEEIEE